MKIQSLLNPFDCGDAQGYRSSESPTLAAMPCAVTSNISSAKRQKIPKDAAIFTDAKVNEPVNFPPHEVDGDEKLAAEHRKFQIYPMGNIREKGARRIPYNSDKKDFMGKTGRDAFEVFQYEFKVPGDDKQYSVLWDYQIGLVRITPFFKCCKYSKTTPAKALGMNPGLRDITFSITGGALAAQGYWMPYKAAKGVAATFCYNIRSALTPVFGKDFLTMCLHPKHPDFAKFTIDPIIVKECTDETYRWRSEGVTCKSPSIEKEINVIFETHNPISTPSTPRIKFACPPWGARPSKPRPAKHVDQESGYGTDEDPREKYMFSPEVSPRSIAWTSINRSQSPASLHTFSPPQPPPRAYGDEHFQAKRSFSKIVSSEDEEQMSHSHTATAKSHFGDDSDDIYIQGSHTEEEINVAEILLSFRAPANRLPQQKRTRHGSRL